MPRVARLAVVGLLAALTHPLDAAATPYQRRAFVPTQPPAAFDLQLKRWRMAAPLGLPLQFGFAASGETRAVQPSPRVPVLMTLDSPAHAAAVGRNGGAHVGRVVSTMLSLDEIDALSGLPGVRRIELARPHHLHLDVNTTKNGAVQARQATRLSGAGVLIGLIDTGIDFTHADFRKPDGSTRVVALWDQLDDSFTTSGGTVGTAPPERDDSGQPFGTLYTEAQVNAALQGTGTVNSLDLVGHGTHVAGCAASNGNAPGGYTGVAPEADLLVVRAGGTSKTDFFFTGDVIGALQWINDQATARHQPAVVNMSFGQHFGGHDGSSAEEIVIDDFVSTPGRVVTVSAGNERNENIHASGSALHSHSLQVEVTSSTSDFLAVDCWLPSSDVIDWAFTDPTGSGISQGNVPVGQCSLYQDSLVQVSLCVDVINPVNGAREAFAAVEPLATGGQITVGRWSLTMLDDGRVSNGHFDCWSVNDQSFVTGGDGSETVAIPGTARGAITAGAATFRDRWPSQNGADTMIGTFTVDALTSFSSSGPTRDGRVKPDIVTGGQWVLSAWSVGDGTGSGLAGVPVDPRRVSADGTHVSSRGTSFSAPQTAGAAALLLQANPTLSASAIADILTSTAQQDSFTGSTPNQLWGHGKLDIAAAAIAVAPPCVGDCDGNGRVDVDELVTTVRIALDLADVMQCRSADHDGNGRVTVDEAQAAVNAALNGCR
ncbi:MAG TPA: S8 family serine peptidase [Candidatus Binatia bacterium]|nr:S8 family serine peptidase [Candidatus Binatia bacterium]